LRAVAVQKNLDSIEAWNLSEMDLFLCFFEIVMAALGS
jgi:hypothetical protein